MEKGKPAIFIFYEPKLMSLLEKHGTPAGLRVSDEGKVDIRWDLKPTKKEKFAVIPEFKDSPVGKFVESHNIGMIVYDSITMPNQIFISGQLNFPGRDQAQGLWFGQLQDAAKLHDMVILASTHITKDDTNKYDTGKAEGGKSVHHNFKIVLRIARYLNPRSKNPVTNEAFVNGRQLVRERFFFEKTGRQAGITRLDLTDEGYKDADAAVDVQDNDE